MNFKIVSCLAFVVILFKIKTVQASCLEYGHSCWGAHGKRSTAGDSPPHGFAAMMEIRDRNSNLPSDRLESNGQGNIYPDRWQTIAMKFRAAGLRNRNSKNFNADNVNGLRQQQQHLKDLFNEKHKRRPTTFVRNPFSMLKFYQLAYQMPRENFQIKSHDNGDNNMEYPDLN